MCKDCNNNNENINECNCEECICEVEINDGQHREPSTWDCLEPMLIDFEETEFQRGIDSVSFVCGMYTALINACVTPEDAFNYIINKENSDHNLQLAEIKKEEAIQIAKINIVKDEMNSI
jgi:hypothetical protein